MTQIQNSSRPAYFDQFKSLDMSRDEDGILIVTMNDGSGGPLTFGGQDHTDFTEAFYRIGRDYDNKVVILTKVDTDAKGGSALSVAYTIGKPLLFIGVGQGYEDQIPFDPQWMIDNIFGN